MIESNENLKRCSSCKIEKVMIVLNKDKKSKVELLSQCKTFVIQNQKIIIFRKWKIEIGYMNIM